MTEAKINETPKNLADQLRDLSIQTKNNRQIDLEKRFEKIKDMAINLLLDEATKNGGTVLMIDVKILMNKMHNSRDKNFTSIGGKELYYYCEFLEQFLRDEGLIVTIRDTTEYTIQWDHHGLF